MTYDELLKRVDSAVKGNDIKTAIEFCDSFILINPDSANGYRKRAGIYARHEWFERAIEDINEAIRLKPQESGFYFFRGWWKLEMDDLNGVIQDQTRAIELEAQALEKLFTESALFFRAFAQLKVGEYKLALIDVERVSDDFLVYLKSTGKITKSEIVQQAWSHLSG